ncbi:MAG: hypothetical protein ACRDPG_14265, partial [Nocardioidaceae bacterium]
RFLVGLRLSGLQLHSHGLAYAGRDIERREAAVIEGFHPDGAAPMDQIRCYQLLILLDKWAALVDEAPGGVRARARIASIKLASGFVRHQARRIQALVAA